MHIKINENTGPYSGRISRPGCGICSCGNRGVGGISLGITTCSRALVVAEPTELTAVH